jgi:hypothetical protein
MGLLIKLNNGDTTLKSLKYGNDQPGGGSSNQPYIKKPIDEEVKSASYYDEFLVRGGIEAPIDALEDVTRLTKYFTDTRDPKGLLFTVKQNILSRVAVKTEASYGFAYGGFTQDFDLKTGTKSINTSNGFFNEGIYTPLSTLAQAGVGWSGTHINKQGLDPTGLLPSFSINKYIDVVYDHNRAERNAEDPKIPYALYRKSQRAQSKIERKQTQLEKQTSKTQNELNTPASQKSLGPLLPRPFRPDGESNIPILQSIESAIASAQSKTSQKIETTLNKFLQKWDDYRDKIALKQLSNKEKDLNKAIGKSEDYQSQINELASAPPVYNNRLLKLWDSTGLNLTNPITSNSNILLSYSGGPDSALGIGKTKIYFATKNDGITPDRTNAGTSGQIVPSTIYNLSNIFGDENTSVSLKYASLNTTISQYDLFGSDNFLEDYNLTTNFQTFDPANTFNSSTNWATWTNFNEAKSTLDDTFLPDFRSYLDIPSNPTILSVSPNYVDKNIENNFNLGNPGQKGNVTNYINGKRRLSDGTRLGPVDKITAYPIYKADASIGSRYPGFGGGNDQDDNLKDLVPFYIAILNNEVQNEETGAIYKKYMHFRAFIDSVSDSYDADWKPIEYMGRAEKFYKYGGFSRKMSLAFKVVAQSREELTPMYDKLNFLASSLAPEYLDESASGYMAGNIAYITLGSYINEQPGIITGLTYNIPEESSWEIGIDEFGESTSPNNNRQLPYMIEVKLDFIPIQKFRPEKAVFSKDTDKTSTRLLGAGFNQYIDQLRPTSSYYDIESQTFNEPAATSFIPIQPEASQNDLTIVNNIFNNTLI